VFCKCDGWGLPDLMGYEFHFFLPCHASVAAFSRFGGGAGRSRTVFGSPDGGGPAWVHGVEFWRMAFFGRMH
jgi:hypothetical protein